MGVRGWVGGPGVGGRGPGGRKRELVKGMFESVAAAGGTAEFHVAFLDFGKVFFLSAKVVESRRVIGNKKQ